MAPGTTKDDPLNMYKAMSDFANKLGRQSDGGEMLFEAAAMRMNAGHKVILNVNPNAPIGHVVNIRKITQILVTKPGSIYPVTTYKINGMSGTGFQNYKFSTLKGFFVFLF